MEKRQLQFKRSERRETKMGWEVYHVFTDVNNGSSLAVKKNKVLGYFNDFKSTTTYTVYLEYGGCLGIYDGNVLIFHWGGYIVQYNYKDGSYSQLNKVPKKVALTTERAHEFALRWFEKNKAVI